jgi:hypothetical protein
LIIASRPARSAIPQFLRISYRYTGVFENALHALLFTIPQFLRIALPTSAGFLSIWHPNRLFSKIVERDSQKLWNRFSEYTEQFSKTVESYIYLDNETKDRGF